MKITIAQRRGVLNKIRESVNAPGEALSGVFSPEFTRLMDTLREVDDEAREHAADLKDMLKVARSSFNRREYMTAISYLGKYHERLELVRYQFGKLIKDVDMVHNEFLFGDLDEEHRKNLFEKMPERLKPRPKVAPAPTPPQQQKAAGVKDWWHNLTNDRGKSLKYWEKKFPRAAKEIKRQTEKMLNRSEMFLNMLMSTFKTLATLRATRKLEEYVKASSVFVDKYNAYDAAFIEYFNGSVKNFIETQKQFEANKATREAEIEARRNRPMEGESAEELVDPDTRPTGVFEKANPSSPATSNPEAAKEEVLKDMQSEIDEKESGDPVAGQPAWNRPSVNAPVHGPGPVVEEERVTQVPPPKPANTASPLIRTINPVPVQPQAPSVQPRGLAPVTRALPPKPRMDIPQTNFKITDHPSNDNATAAEFLDKLTKLADQNPLVLAREIIVFAKSIAETNKETSDRLLKIAQQLIKQ